MSKPKIIIPLGDPAGIGPEIVAKALASPETSRIADCIVVGDAKIMEKAIRLVGADLRINILDESALQTVDKNAPVPQTRSTSEPPCSTDKAAEPNGGDHHPGVLNLIDMDNIDMAAFEYGKVSAMCGQAAFEYIKKSIELTLAGKADAVATTPINKESLHAANVPFIGHTEIFGALTGTPDPLTMFETNGLRVFFLTRHLSLRDMLGQITKTNIIACVKECTNALRRLGVTDGTMAIAGLNPHCGEHGLFGWEEVNEITPAVEELQRQGYRVTGPIGADSVFHQAAVGRYNSVLSLYHDQGHIATKTLDFERTISITNGMPILRTSVDHGTAFDIAGTGLASGVSMAEAIRLAAKYAPCFSN